MTKIIKSYFGFIFETQGILALCFVFSALIILLNGDNVSAACSVSISTEEDIEIEVIPGNANITANIVNSKTDCANGYSLFISGPEDRKLYLDGDSNKELYINTANGTYEAPALLNINTYGYSLNPNTTPLSETFIGLSNDRTLIASTDSPSPVEGDNTTIYYGANIAINKAAGSYKMSSGGITYYIVANPLDSFTITFDANGGTIPAGENWQGSGDIATKEITVGDPYNIMPTPEKTGYHFLGWSQLPKNYQQVEYIESTGTQYILTNIVPSNNTGVYIKVSSSDIASDKVYFGSSSTGTDKYFAGNIGGRVYISWNTTPSQNARPLTELNQINEIKLNYLNDRKKHFNSDYNTDIEEDLIINNTPIALFGANMSGIVEYKSNIKLYDLKITEGNTITHDFIPCYQKNTGEIGLYDIYTDVFYTNQGEREFLKGADNDLPISTSTIMNMHKNHILYAVWKKKVEVSFDTRGGNEIDGREYIAGLSYNNLPTPEKAGYVFKGWVDTFLDDEYIKLTSITSSGAQYINTGIQANNTKGIYAVASSNNTTDDVIYFGSRQATNTRMWVGNQSNKIYYGWNNNTFSQEDIEKGTIYTIKLNYLNNRKSLLNDALIYDIGTETLDTSNNREIYIFAGNNNGNPNYYAKITLYEFRISDNDSDIANFIPCYRVSDGIIGLYDTYGNNNVYFYPDARGNTPFIAGKSSLVDNNTTVANNEDHTLYALWEEE